LNYNRLYYVKYGRHMTDFKYRLESALEYWLRCHGSVLMFRFEALDLDPQLRGLRQLEIGVLCQLLDGYLEAQ